MFSYGVWPAYQKEKPVKWDRAVRKYLKDLGISGEWAVITEGPSRKHPDMNHMLELLELNR